MGNTQSLCQGAAADRLSSAPAGTRAGDQSGGLGDNAVLVEKSDVPNAPGGSAAHHGVAAEAAEEREDALEEASSGDVEPQRVLVLETVPLDPRFPSPNASRFCYTLYNEYHRCKALRGEDGDAECEAYARKYRSICPAEWIERWNGLREEGRWFGKY